MCTHPNCDSSLVLIDRRPEGFLFERTKCGQVFLVKTQSPDMVLELYDDHGAYNNCGDCINHLCMSCNYDNGHIFQCAQCGRRYRVYLNYFYHVNGTPIHHH